MEQKKCNYMGFRLPAEEALLLRQVAEARGEGLSSFLRRAVKRELFRLGFLSPKERRALGGMENE